MDWKLLFQFIVILLILLTKIGDFVVSVFNHILKTKTRIKKLFTRLFRKIHPKIKKSEIIFTSPRYKNIFFKEDKIEFFLIDKAKNLAKNTTFTYRFFIAMVSNLYYTFKNITLKIKKRKHKKKKKESFLSSPFIIKFKYFILGFIFSSLFIFTPLLFLIFLQDLPSPKELVTRQIPQTTKIYDRNNTLLYQIYAQQNRTMVPLYDIPKNLKNATIAIEDKDFYKHPGFDVSAIIRSAYKDLSGKGLQGGSTITQQLIKSALLTSETTISRKIKEVILAFWAERIYSKNQILEMYFNQVPYGGTAWGVEAASETYFGKPAKNLDLAESAFLAGIPKAPTIYSPYGSSPTLWKTRQKEVLKKMINLGFISQKEAAIAEKEILDFRTPQVPIHAPHFVMYIKDLLVKKYGLPLVEKGGLIVTTTLDLKLQKEAQKIVTDEVNSNNFLNLTNGASLITNPTNGDILAMVGSKDFSDPAFGNVNITTSRRQPGSSIKVVTYSAALSKGITAATIIDDSPVSFPDGERHYSPVNYDGQFHGKVPVRLALANSFNIPAVKILNQIGIGEMVNLGRKMGIKSWDDSGKYGLSITLGAAETTMIDMASVYGVLANSGIKVDPNPFVKITDYKGNVLEEKDFPKKYSAQGPIDEVLASEINKRQLFFSNVGKRVLDEKIAFIISNILSDNNARTWEFGPNSPLNVPGKTVSVKTGTSDNKRDNWTIGYTPNYVVAVWVGNNDNSPMSQNLASGITGAAPIWNKIMTGLLKDFPDIKPAQPLDIVQKPCLGTTEYFIKGTENSVNCNSNPATIPSSTTQQR